MCFFFKQKTAYDMRISDWSSDVCSSDLTLASFLRANFLTPAVVARRMRRVDVASAIGKFLAAPPERGRLWRGASRLIADVLESLDQERLGGMVKGALAGRLREINVAPALGRALKAAMKGDRHVPHLGAGLRRASTDGHQS